MLKISSATQWLRNASHYFVNPKKIHNAEAQYRALVLAGCIIVLAMIAMVVVVILIPQWLQGIIDINGLFINLSMLVSYIICLFFLKHTGNNIITANLAALPLYISLLYSSMIIGGPAATSNEIMVLIPLIVYFTAGGQSAALWAVITLLTQLTFFIMYKSGYVFTQTLSASSIINQGLLHWLVTLMGILGIARVYEKTHYHLINQRDKRENDNQFLSTHDPLTGLINRQHAISTLNEYIKSIKSRLTFTVMLIDIDHFYTINAEFGMTIGDQILCNLSERLTSTPMIKMAARTNGNQFLVVSHSNAQDSDSNELIEKVLQIITAPYVIEHRIISLPIHMGLSFLSANKNHAEALLNEAETSLKKAKRSPFTYLNEYV